MSRITHFEIYGDEPETLAAFYRELFGWQVDKVDGVSYWRIGMSPGGDGLSGGGLTYLPPFDATGWLHYVNVNSIDNSIAAAERMGASIIRPKTAVPRTAWTAVLADPAGHKFAIWQPDPLAFPPPEPD